MAEMERLAQQLPAGFGFQWTGISYEEKQSAGQLGMLLGLSLVVVLLLLAALYDSWSVPVAVDRKSVVEGKSVAVRVELGGRRFIYKKKQNSVLYRNI